MNTDPQKSAQPCGCDEGANHKCAECTRKIQLVTDLLERGIAENNRIYDKAMDAVETKWLAQSPGACQDAADAINEADLEKCLTSRLTSDFSQPFEGVKAPSSGLFPHSAQGRKDHPVFTGVLMYFPDAIAAVAHVSKLGNDQHNPGQPLHWARGKSTDQTDTATRHMMDHGVGNIRDTDGTYHLAKAAWRILAELQLTIEKDRKDQQ